MKVREMGTGGLGTFVGRPRTVIDGRGEAVGRESARVGRDEGCGADEGTGDFVVSWDEFGETIACRVVSCRGDAGGWRGGLAELNNEGWVAVEADGRGIRVAYQQQAKPSCCQAPTTRHTTARPGGWTSAGNEPQGRPSTLQG